MTEATARAMLVKRARDDGCTCESGSPQVAFRESDGKQIILVGHEEDCARTQAGGSVSVEMRVLMMHVSKELDEDAWEEAEVEL